MRILVLLVLSGLLGGCAAPAQDAVSSTPGVVPSETAAPEPVVSGVRLPTPPVTDASIAAWSSDQPAAPTRLLITGIALDMTIEPVGLAADSTMEIPAAASVAGWYEHGRSPASGKGNTVLAAHVDDGTIGLGPFAGLKRLEPGSQVDVVDAAGVQHSFVVTRVEQTAKTTVDPALVFSRDGPPQLVLVTCGGRWDERSRHYEDNVIVWAEPMQVAS